MNIFINLSTNSWYNKDILGPLVCVLPNTSKFNKRPKLYNPKPLQSQEINKR